MEMNVQERFTSLAKNYGFQPKMNKFIFMNDLTFQEWLDNEWNPAITDFDKAFLTQLRRDLILQYYWEKGYLPYIGYNIGTWIYNTFWKSTK